MATTLRVTTGANVGIDYQSTPDVLQSYQVPASSSVAKVYLSTDTGGTKATKKYVRDIEIPELGEVETINFNSLPDGLGTNTNMTTCRVLHIECSSGEGTVSFTDNIGSANGVGDSAADPFVRNLVAGETWHQEKATAAGYTSDSGSSLIFTRTSGTFTCRVALVGE